jgi:hypothetical protein
MVRTICNSLFLALLGPGLVWAAQYNLGGAINDVSYYKNVSALKEGDEVRFGSEIFLLSEFLGQGASTRVFAISKDKVIRIPIAKSARWLICETLTGFQKIAKSRVYAVRVFVDQSSRYCEYAIAQRINAEFTVSDWLTYRISNGDMFPGQISKLDQVRRAINSHDLEKAFQEFAKSTFEFIQLSDDFDLDQIVWAGDKFILVDWTSEFRKTQSLHPATTFMTPIESRFSRAYGFSKHYIKETINIILAEREKRKNCQQFLLSVL